MRTLCFYFQVHQPYRLRSYRFFDIGSNPYYFDDFQNQWIFHRVAEKCYLPTNAILLDLINKYKGAFKVSFSFSGVVLDQMERFAPNVLESFRRLVDTGCVEILSETYMHSLVSLTSEEEFKAQVKLHAEKVQQLFGVLPQVFRNTELIYSDAIGQVVSDMGFKAQLTEGAKHILGWKSPNYLYASKQTPGLKLLLKNFVLSDDIAFRFSQQSWEGFPLTTEKYTQALQRIDPAEQCVNLFMDYETFGEHQWKETGIFEFLKYLPERVFSQTDYSFSTPSEIVDTFPTVGEISVPDPISWADEERDLSAWIGNELQNDAFSQIYDMEKAVFESADPEMIHTWRYLQTSDHFYYMCTKWFSDGDVHKYFNPYNSPYEAYINYMNVLSDFRLRLDRKNVIE